MADVLIGGIGIAPRHCVISLKDGSVDADLEVVDPVTAGIAAGRAVYIECISNRNLCVNGEPVEEGANVQLRHGDRILIGTGNLFKYNDPAAALAAKEYAEAQGLNYKAPVLDYAFAQREYSAKQAAAAGIALEAEADAEEKERAAQMAEQMEAVNAEKERVRQELEAERSRIAALLEDKTRGDAETAALQAQLAEQLEKAKIAEREGRERENEAREAARKERDRKELEETISQVLPMVNEVNIVGEEFGLPVRFSVELRTEIYQSAGKDHKRSVVYVSLTDEDTGRETLWPSAKFIQRGYRIRELYAEALENGVDETLAELTQEEDPFYDGDSAAQLIGSATVYLPFLWYCMPHDTTTRIFSSAGGSDDSKGQIHCVLEPVIPEGVDEDTLDDGALYELGTEASIRVRILDITGLSPKLCKDVYVKYKFFLGDYTETPPVMGGNVDPEFNYEEVFTVTSTQQFQDYLQNGMVVFEVWGHHTTEARPVTSSASRKSTKRISVPVGGMGRGNNLLREAQADLAGEATGNLFEGESPLSKASSDTEQSDFDTVPISMERSSSQLAGSSSTLREPQSEAEPAEPSEPVSAPTPAPSTRDTPSRPPQQAEVVPERAAEPAPRASEVYEQPMATKPVADRPAPPAAVSVSPSVPVSPSPARPTPQAQAQAPVAAAPAVDTAALPMDDPLAGVVLPEGAVIKTKTVIQNGKEVQVRYIEMATQPKGSGVCSLM
ncbi:kinesin-like protein, partial [Kipferlia bialata]|eukprot:g9349.t1